MDATDFTLSGIMSLFRWSGMVTCIFLLLSPHRTNLCVCQSKVVSELCDIWGAGVSTIKN